MKIKFPLQVLVSSGFDNAEMRIIGEAPKYKPYVNIEVVNRADRSTRFLACIPDRSLETFAVNILKALKSKRLK